jgi:hypothetical protein
LLFLLLLKVLVAQGIADQQLAITVCFGTMRIFRLS